MSVKFLLLIFICITSFSLHAQEYILIRHVGAQDHEIFTRVITHSSLSKADSAIIFQNSKLIFATTIIVTINNSNYSALKDWILSNDLISNDIQNLDFGVFEIEIFKKNESKKVYLPSKHIAQVFFENLIKFAKEKKFAKDFLLNFEDLKANVK